MASRKAYAYYLRGSQLALIEQDSVMGDGQTLTPPGLNDVGPDGSQLWKSPLTSVTDGIEIEYAYSPAYLTPAKLMGSGTSDNYHSYNCWFAVDGYLTLGAGTVDFTDYPSLAVDSHILIKGSERWNGIHKVKAVQNISGTVHGGVQTYTRINQPTKHFADTDVDYVTDETITGVNSEFQIIFSASPSSNEYIWISGSDSSGGWNNTLYSGWSYSGTTLDLSSATLYGMNNLEESYGITTTLADTAVSVNIYEAFREVGGAQFHSGVELLEDESDTIDLSGYLAKALVYYVKAKLAEDVLEMDKKDYFMKEFYAIIEKHESSKIWGARMISPGPNAIR